MLSSLKTLVILSILLFSSVSHGQQAQPSATKSEEVRASFDFEETALNGAAKAPPGLSLNGRTEQGKTQMVRLRRDFREKLLESKPAAEAIGRARQ